MLQRLQSISRLLLPQTRAYCFQALTRSPETIVINGVDYTPDEWINITERTITACQRQIIQLPHHPLNILATAISDYIQQRFVDTPDKFHVHRNIEPMVTTAQNFDSLHIPVEHAVRQRHECIYVNRSQLLRSHMAAHYAERIAAGETNFLLVGDVYRRDCIDRLHNAKFHQLDGMRIVDRDSVTATTMEQELKTLWTEMLKEFTRKDIDCRWTESKSLVTPGLSWNLELPHKDQYVKIMRSGIIENGVIDPESIAWNFSVGLERLAIVLFDIPDIRLLSVENSQFLRQFHAERRLSRMKFKPFVQKASTQQLDAFFLLEDGVTHDAFCLSDFYDLVRTIGQGNVEQVRVDEYFNPMIE